MNAPVPVQTQDQAQGKRQDSADRVSVGVIGLGIMGSAYAQHLLDAGHKVIGLDVSEDRLKALEAAGGVCATDLGELVSRSRVIVAALSSIAAYRTVISAPTGLAGLLGPDHLLIDTGTFALDMKEEARRHLQARGAGMVDAPVTGTSIHALSKDLVVYASGDSAHLDAAEPILRAFAKNVRRVGAFGAGIKLKLVTNHLVAIHTAAAAEALSLARSAGLDLQLVHELIADGPASSGVFGFRGPMMVSDRFEPATMRMDVFAKDLQTISDFSHGIAADTPLFDASRELYAQALEQQMGAQDIAAVYRQFRRRSAPAPQIKKS